MAIAWEDEDLVLIKQGKEPGDPWVITVNCPDKVGLGCDVCRIVLDFGLCITKGGRLPSLKDSQSKQLLYSQLWYTLCGLHQIGCDTFLILMILMIRAVKYFKNIILRVIVTSVYTDIGRDLSIHLVFVPTNSGTKINQTLIDIWMS